MCQAFCLAPNSKHVAYMLANIVLATYIGTLFRNKRFMLNEIDLRNTSKFAIFLEYKNLST